MTFDEFCAKYLQLRRLYAFDEFCAKYPKEDCLACGNQSPHCPECGGFGFWLYEDNEFRTREEMFKFFTGEWCS